MSVVKLDIPQDVQSVIDDLEKHGYTAYIVGGCVRDALMGKPPHDYDICTSATPEQMMSVFSHRHIIETGLKHGTITVKGNDDCYEVTTYRVDGEYRDGRHPDGVVFVDNIEADLARRDFTVNAMAYNVKTGLIDPFGGASDIENRIIRCVGDANKRFNEDALRIMRAVRFSAVCGFSIEENTHKAMLTHKDLLRRVSVERKMSEFCKMLQKADFDTLNNYKDIFATFIPELKASFGFEQHNWHHCYNVYEHMMHSVANAPEDLTVRLALFFHDIGKPQVYIVDDKGIGHFYGHSVVSQELTEDIMKRMRFDTQTIRNVCELVGAHDMVLQPTEKCARKMLSRFGETQLRRLIAVQRCDKKAQTVNEHSTQTLVNLDKLEQCLEIVLQKGECVSVKDLQLNGNDLLACGIPSGKLIGDTLKYLLEKVIENPENNTKDALMKLAMHFVCEKGFEI